MPEAQNSDFAAIIAQNKEEWDKLLFLLKDPNPNVLWINYDTARLKKPLHDALAEYVPELKPYDIYISEKTESLARIILSEEKDKIPSNSIIHIFGLEDAVKSADFLGNLNFQRDTLFRQTPAHIIFWADFATSAVLTHKAYDFWSWVVFTFDFTTPEELLTARQKDFKKELILENTEIQMPSKDGEARIRHLEDEWEEFLKSVNGKPSTIRQMKDSVTIAIALALEYKEEGRYNNAKSVLEHVLLVNPDLLSKNNKTQINNILSNIYFQLNDIEKAVKFAEETLSGTLEEYGEEGSETAIALSNLAVAYADLQNLDRAKDLLEKALKIDIKTYGENHPNVAVKQSNLGTVYRDLGNLDKAKILLEKALKIDTDAYGEDHRMVAIRQANLAEIYKDLGDLNKARSLLESALANDINNYGELHPNTAMSNNNLSIVYYYLGLFSKAIAHMQIAYDISVKTFGADHLNTQNSLRNLQHFKSQHPPA